MSPQPAGSQANAPLPPDITQQQQSPGAAASVFAMQGLNQPQPGMEQAQQLMSMLQQLDQWAGQFKPLLDRFDPSLSVLLQPIAQAGLDLQQALQDKLQQSGMARGSPVVPPQPPQSPVAGPPNPTQ